MSICFCSFDGVNENVWYVLEVELNFFVVLVGFRLYSDYIIGVDIVMNEFEDLFSFIEIYEVKLLKFYVYNIDIDNCWEVIIILNFVWGGEGSLGCGIGYGYLYWIFICLFEEGKKIFFLG